MYLEMNYNMLSHSFSLKICQGLHLIFNFEAVLKLIKLQGFVPIAEVDTKGRRCRLPIKADIRKALCFPGGSTLMVLHLNQDVSGNTSDSLKLGVSLKPNGNSTAALGNQVLEFSRGNRNTLNAKNQTSSRSENYQPETLVNDGLPREDNQSVGR